MLRSKAKLERRCGWCGQAVAGSGYEARGRVFCNPWHAEHFARERQPFLKRLLKAFLAGDRTGGGSCC
jgi:uncharacterized Ntn-hydrolase superfamily protein